MSLAEFEKACLDILVWWYLILVHVVKRLISAGRCTQRAGKQTKWSEESHASFRYLISFLKQVCECQKFISKCYFMNIYAAFSFALQYMVILGKTYCKIRAKMMHQRCCSSLLLKIFVLTKIESLQIIWSIYSRESRRFIWFPPIHKYNVEIVFLQSKKHI